LVAELYVQTDFFLDESLEQALLVDEVVLEVLFVDSDGAGLI
jgi:hypothetical protein